VDFAGIKASMMLHAEFEFFSNSNNLFLLKNCRKFKKTFGLGELIVTLAALPKLEVLCEHPQY
jgi:hypothetical protein